MNARNGDYHAIKEFAQDQLSKFMVRKCFDFDEILICLVISVQPY